MPTKDQDKPVQLNDPDTRRRTNHREHTMIRAMLSPRLAALLLAFGWAVQSPAATVYGTTFTSPGQIVRIDTDSHQVIPLTSTSAFPHGLVFDSFGRIVYSVFGGNQVRRYDPLTNTDSFVMGGFSGPLNIAMEPGNGTVLVSNETSPRIDRLNLTTDAVSTLLAGAGGGGIVYDAGGRLFANLPGRLAEIDATTGATLQSTPGNLVLYGLAYDPQNGALYATNGLGGQVLRFDRNNLSLGGGVIATILGGGSGFAGGIVADGAGNLFVAVRNIANEPLSGLYQVNNTTGAFQQVANLPFLSELAPIVGLGAAPSITSVPAMVPTLSEMALLALSMLLLAAGWAMQSKRSRERLGR
jgi:DNA-binding beta-propeller fold protein YncE